MKTFIITFLLFVVFNSSFGQGCSDAGICSVNHHTKSDEEQFKNSVEVATFFGAGKSDVTYFSPYVSYSRKINKVIDVTAKITFSSAQGSFGTRAAFGDSYLIGNYTFKKKNNFLWSILLGWKFPFTSSNLKINYFSIPMDYQSSLGTFDLFLGTNLNYKNWDFNAVLQIPIFNNNKNSYFDEFSNSNDFPTTNLFKRKSDALFRITYHVKPKTQKFVIKPSVLLIYHLGNDSYENVFGERMSISNSSGLTINGNLITIYNLNRVNRLELSVAKPFLVRDIRPDGLTRSYIAGLTYSYSF